MANIASFVMRDRCWIAIALVAWIASGTDAAGQNASTHPDRGIDCTSCHPCGQTATVNAPTCSSCHDGDGTVLGGATPPVTAGWTDSSSTGDPHGAAGDLPPMECGSCHTGHDSPNAFVLASDGVGASISPEGVGAERFCSRCHATRHAGCARCHYSGVDPIVDGAPCFQCHGHDFALVIDGPDGTTEPWYCSHCHAGGFHASTAPPPEITELRVVMGYDRARVVWRSTSPVRGAIEWGVSEPTRTNRNRALASDQSVALPGLAEGVPYTFRVRMSDVRRQVVRTSLATLTPGTAMIPLPRLWGNEFSNIAPPVTVTFDWYEETDPPGLPVTFEWQLSNVASFAPVYGAGLTTSTSVTMDLPLDRWWYYRVRARFSDRPTWSAWSRSGQFVTRTCANCH